MVLLGTVSALLIVALLAVLQYTWRAAGRARRRSRAAFRPGPDADAALRRHPASGGRHAALAPVDQAGGPSPQWPGPAGPDDDPEFIDALERLIRGDNGTYPPA
jgi:hypothetical protein